MIFILPIKTKWEISDKYENIPNFKTFEEFVANSYCNEIKRVVIRQKYRWKALNPKYLEFKRNKGRYTGKWINTGTLIKNLRLRKIKPNLNDFCIDCKPTKHLDLNFIARCNEYGTLTIPARPLFRRTLRYYKMSIDKHYKKYVSSAKSSMKQKGIIE